LVFATKWRADRLLYFRHAPPPTPQDVFRDEDLPKEPFKGAPPHMRSVYYFWWAFLREHKGYRQFCATQKGNYEQLFRDFGDVFHAEFKSWWDGKGRFTFCEPLERNVRVHKPDAEGRITDIRRPEEKIVLSLPAHGDLHRILAEVEELIIRERPDIEARASWSQAKYAVAAKPVLSSLHQHLVIWKLRQQHPEGTMALHELAKVAGLAFAHESDTKEQRAIVVSRYLRQAACIIEHVGQGHFPILRPSQLKPENPKTGRKDGKAK
jgi:hypothetical protein